MAKESGGGRLEEEINYSGLKYRGERKTSGNKGAMHKTSDFGTI